MCHTPLCHGFKNISTDGPSLRLGLRGVSCLTVPGGKCFHRNPREPSDGRLLVCMCARPRTRVEEKWGWLGLCSFFPPFSFSFNYMFLTKRCGPWQRRPDSPPLLTTGGEEYRGVPSTRHDSQHQRKHKPRGQGRATAASEWAV